MTTSVHPHACGEQPTVTAFMRRYRGSSPRVWGAVQRPTSRAHRHRFIPTRVGNSRCLESNMLTETVHPHACGEQSRSGWIRSWHAGSSPRVWGTGAAAHSRTRARRFIPTRVGNRRWARPVRRRRSVHPHACGEQQRARRGRARGAGSSPRVWGTVGCLVHQLVESRFIPTRVGNSAIVAGTASAATVHPHACGEQSPRQKCQMLLTGSSPRVWGTGAAARLQLARVRFIPTRVGNRS